MVANHGKHRALLTSFSLQLMGRQGRRGAAGTLDSGAGAAGASDSGAGAAGTSDSGAGAGGTSDSGAGAAGTSDMKKGAGKGKQYAALRHYGNF